MEQETLVTKLTEKIGETNLSQRTISEYAKSIMPLVTSDEVVNDAFLETHGNILKTIGGQLRHDLASGIEDFKKNYKPEPKQKQDVVQQDDDKYAKLMNEMKELKDSLAKKDAEAAKNAVMHQVSTLLAEKIKEATGSEPNAFVFKNTVRDIEIGEKPNISQIVKDAQKAYDENLKAAGLEPDSPHYNGGGGSGKNKTLDSFFERKAAKEGWNKKQ